MFGQLARGAYNLGNMASSAIGQLGSGSPGGMYMGGGGLPGGGSYSYGFGGPGGFGAGFGPTSGGGFDFGPVSFTPGGGGMGAPAPIGPYTPQGVWGGRDPMSAMDATSYPSSFGPGTMANAFENPRAAHQLMNYALEDLANARTPEDAKRFLGTMANLMNNASNMNQFVGGNTPYARAVENALQRFPELTKPEQSGLQEAYLRSLLNDTMLQRDYGVPARAYSQ